MSANLYLQRPLVGSREVCNVRCLDRWRLEKLGEGFFLSLFLAPDKGAKVKYGVEQTRALALFARSS